MNQRAVITQHLPTPSPPPRVEVIDDYPRFAALRAEWDALHADDPESGIFLSWSWYQTTFATNPRRWRVFVVRESSAPHRVLCIFPTKYRVHWSKSLGVFQTEIEAAGRLNWGEYSGFVCDPAQEQPALVALAAHISQMPWVRLSLRYESSARRADLFTAAFNAADFRLQWKPYLINSGTVDNLKCPRLHLPDSFATWQERQLSSNTRQKLRRYWRSYMDNGLYHTTFTQPETFDRDTEILLSYWLKRWAPSKGSAKAKAIADDYHTMLAEAQRLGAMHISVLWEGARPIAALGGVVDWDQKKLHFVLSGRDEDDPSPAIGLLIHATNIQWAIENGLKVYDFGHGNEPYKYSFGSVEEQVKYFELSRRNDLATTLDPLCHGEVLRRLPFLLRSGGIELAIAACQSASGSMDDV